MKKPRVHARLVLDRETKSSLLATVCTLILTLPALLGSCCWPLLVAGFLGISSTLAARVASHSFSLAISLSVLTNLIQLFYHSSQVKPGTNWQRFGPTYLLALATSLILADQVRHVLQDSEIWSPPASNMYQDDCDATWFKWCLTPVGWIFAVACTYLGFTLMVVAVLLQTKFITKIKRAWLGEDCGCDVV